MALHFTGIFHTLELRPPTSATLRPGELGLAAIAATAGPPPAAPPPTREPPQPTPPPLTLEVEVFTGKRVLLTMPDDAHIEDVAAAMEHETQWPVWLQQYFRPDGVALPVCTPLRRHLPLCRVATLHRERSHAATTSPEDAPSVPCIRLRHSAWDEHHILDQFIRRTLPPVGACSVLPNARVSIEFSHHISILQAPGAATLRLYEAGQEARSVDVTQLWNDLGRVLTLIPKQPLRSGARYKVHVRGSSFQAARPPRVLASVRKPEARGRALPADGRPASTVSSAAGEGQLAPLLEVEHAAGTRSTRAPLNSECTAATAGAAATHTSCMHDGLGKAAMHSLRSALSTPSVSFATATDAAVAAEDGTAEADSPGNRSPAAVGMHTPATTRAAAASSTCMHSSRALLASKSQKWWRAGRAALSAKATNEEAAFGAAPSRAVHQLQAKGGDSWHVRLTDYLWEFRVMPPRS